MNITRKSLGLLATVAVATGTIVAAAPVALAGTGTSCSGTSCDGLDPSASFNAGTGQECTTGDSTVHSESVLGGTLELRYGPDCGTNWTRFTPGNSDKYQIWVTNLDTGVWAGSGLYNSYVFSNSRGVSHYSDQVYSPGPAAACVEDETTNSPDECYNQ